MSDKTLQAHQKTKYLKIVRCLWSSDPEDAHQEYPDISVAQFVTANAYYDSLRCEGCHCGSCVRLPELASDLDNSPTELLPIAQLAIKLGKEAFDNDTE